MKFIGCNVERNTNILEIREGDLMPIEELAIKLMPDDYDQTQAIDFQEFYRMMHHLSRLSGEQLQQIREMVPPDYEGGGGYQPIPRRRKRGTNSATYRRCIKARGAYLTPDGR